MKMRNIFAYMAMAVLLLVVWVGMVGVSTWLERSKAAAPQQEM